MGSTSRSNLTQTLCFLGPLFQQQGDLVQSYTSSPVPLGVHNSIHFWHYPEFTSDPTRSRASLPGRLPFFKHQSQVGSQATHISVQLGYKYEVSRTPSGLRSHQNHSQDSGKCCTSSDHLIVKDTHEGLDEKCIGQGLGTWRVTQIPCPLLMGSRPVPCQPIDVFTNHEAL